MDFTPTGKIDYQSDTRLGVAMLKFDSTLHTEDKTGELYVRYTPVLEGGYHGRLFTGKLSFASYDVSVGEPIAAHNAAKANAKANALEVLAAIIDFENK